MSNKVLIVTRKSAYQPTDADGSPNLFHEKISQADCRAVAPSYKPRVLYAFQFKLLLREAIDHARHQDPSLSKLYDLIEGYLERKFVPGSWAEFQEMWGDDDYIEALRHLEPDQVLTDPTAEKLSRLYSKYALDRVQLPVYVDFEDKGYEVILLLWDYTGEEKRIYPVADSHQPWRLAWIDAVCRDCGVTEGDNILYVHDRQWGKSSANGCIVEGHDLSAEAKREFADGAAGLCSRFIRACYFMHQGAATYFSIIKTRQYASDPLAQQIRLIEDRAASLPQQRREIEELIRQKIASKQ